MTEKRFWCLDKYKGETSPIVDGRFSPTNEWLCNKLNELNDKNKVLRKQRYEDINDLSVVIIKYKALKKENKKLKDKIKKLEAENKAQSDAIDGLQEFIVHFDLEELDF